MTVTTNEESKYMQTAIVYDWIDTWGGAERVLLTLSEIFPDAHFYTSYFDQDKARWAHTLDISTSFMQRLPAFIRKSRVLSAPLYPFTFESFDFSEYDLVISVTSSYAKSIITRPNSLHICYMLSPTRFLWDQPEAYTPNLVQSLARPYIQYLKRWDRIAAQRPDKIITLSDFVKNNIKKYYDRDSLVLYPPFDTDYWMKIARKNGPTRGSAHYYLVVSRLEPYKKIDLAIKTFNALDGPTRGSAPTQRLIIIGSGSQIGRLKRMAGNNISFIEHITDQQLAHYYNNARALIMPQKEEFGYTAIEAQFFGCPVISYSQGGVKETVSNGKTGIFFDHQTQDSLIAAIEKFESMYYTLSTSAKTDGPKQAEKFEKKKFTKTFMNYLDANLS